LKVAQTIALFAALTALASCHDVLFRDAKRLPGDYELLKWEDGLTYYITAPGKHNEHGCGPIDGTVLELGWSTRHIVAKRHSCWRGDPDGWMVVDAQTHQVSGPFSDAKLAEIEGIRKIPTYSSVEAWGRLPCFTKFNSFGWRTCTAPWDHADR
jgi:hypothetical protein